MHGRTRPALHNDALNHPRTRARLERDDAAEGVLEEARPPQCALLRALLAHNRPRLQVRGSTRNKRFRSEASKCGRSENRLCEAAEGPAPLWCATYPTAQHIVESSGHMAVKPNTHSKVSFHVINCTTSKESTSIACIDWILFT